MAARKPRETTSVDNLDGLFESDDRGAQRLFQILRDPKTQDLKTNRFDRIFYTDGTGPKMVDRVFSGPEQYRGFVNQLLSMTDAGISDISESPTPVIEASFLPDKTNLHGSIIVFTSDLTHGDPAVTIRKQPAGLVTLEQMLDSQVLSVDMYNFLQQAIRGRLNILVSGATGVGKTTLARALSWLLDPAQRIVTVEEIDELHLADRLPNVLSLFTRRWRNDDGVLLYEETLDDLVRHALRARADRIWVGETRGKEAYALVKACLSGHDGSVTTIHANNGQQAVKQLISYMMEGEVTEEVARDQIAQAFHVVVQLGVAKMGRRVVTEITELESVREGTEQRRNPLFEYDQTADQFLVRGRPTTRILHQFERYGVNYGDWPTGR